MSGSNGSTASKMPGAAPQDGRLRSHVSAFLTAVRTAPNRGRVYARIAAVILAIFLTTVGQVRLNAWQRDFYDALNQRHVDAFMTQLLVFAAIISVLLSLGVAQTWVRETLKIELRDAVTSDLLAEWLRPRRAYKLGWAGDVGVNPDQRIHEDARHLCDLWADLGIGLFQSALLLVSFVGVLWVLSAHTVLDIGGSHVAVPGFMVWCALAYALAGSWLTWRVGRPLIPLNAEHYAREADLRFALVHTNENAEALGLYAGEGEVRDEIAAALGRVLAVLRRTARGLANLTWVTAGYGWLALVVPVVVAAPGYFGGHLTFGELMMVTGAFFQVQQALRWFVDNFPTIADWRATLLRVMALRLALPPLDDIGGAAGRIGFGRHPEGRLALEALVVALPEKRVSLAGGSIELKPGERVLLTGGPALGKSMLFRAIAGLWPCGEGRVLLPPEEDLLFLPQRPYMPLGSLRQALAFPALPERFPDDAVRRAVERVGMGRMAAHLDEVRRWDKELALEELQILAFARVLLHRPKWLVMDDPWSALDAARRGELCGLLATELSGAAVLALGRPAAASSFFARVAELVETRDGRPFDPLPSARTAKVA